MSKAVVLRARLAVVRCVRVPSATYITVLVHGHDGDSGTSAEVRKPPLSLLATQGHTAVALFAHSLPQLTSRTVLPLTESTCAGWPSLSSPALAVGPVHRRGSFTAAALFASASRPHGSHSPRPRSSPARRSGGPSPHGSTTWAGRPLPSSPARRSDDPSPYGSTYR